MSRKARSRPVRGGFMIVGAASGSDPVTVVPEPPPRTVLGWPLTRPGSYGLSPRELLAETRRLVDAGWQLWEVQARLTRGSLVDYWVRGV